VFIEEICHIYKIEEVIVPQSEQRTGIELGLLDYYCTPNNNSVALQVI